MLLLLLYSLTEMLPPNREETGQSCVQDWEIESTRKFKERLIFYEGRTESHEQQLFVK